MRHKNPSLIERIGSSARSFLSVGLISTSLLLGTGCEKNDYPHLSKEMAESVSSAIKNDYFYGYSKLRKEVNDEFLKVAYDAEFFLQHRENSDINEQIKYDEDWLNRMKGDKNADFWRAYLLYLHGKREEAFEIVKPMDRLHNGFRWKDTDLDYRIYYLIGSIYADKNYWLSATSYFDFAQKGYGEFARRAKEKLDEKGIVEIRPKNLIRPILRGITKKFNGKTIVEYSPHLADPSFCCIKYENSEKAREDLEKWKREYAVVATGPMEYFKPGPRDCLNIHQEGRSITLESSLIKQPPTWENIEKNVFEDEGRNYYRNEKFLVFQKSPEVFFVYDFGFDSTRDGGLFSFDGIGSSCETVDVRVNPALVIGLNENYIAIRNYQREVQIKSEDCISSAYMIIACIISGLGPEPGALALPGPPVFYPPVLAY